MDFFMNRTLWDFEFQSNVAYLHPSFTFDELVNTSCVLLNDRCFCATRLGSSSRHVPPSPNQARYELYVSFDFEGRSYFARYNSFRILGEKENYKLLVDGFNGNVKDQLNHHNGMEFSTKDRDNDLRADDNCASKYHSAWWHNDCHVVNLNGVWASTDFGRGINWASITTFRKSATNVEMKIRKLFTQGKQLKLSNPENDLTRLVAITTTEAAAVLVSVVVVVVVVVVVIVVVAVVAVVVVVVVLVEVVIIVVVVWW
ncbi:ficolin-1 [Elysia marginata]|uniref:Ficolin-1 n=1 Tax=Elysia marginata TaxID=1093978 RepID=A0AAV4JZ51_9GAST|nr:ficolin-1 [Elysia marginata]